MRDGLDLLIVPADGVHEDLLPAWDEEVPVVNTAAADARRKIQRLLELHPVEIEAIHLVACWKERVGLGHLQVVGHVSVQISRDHLLGRELVVYRDIRCQLARDNEARGRAHFLGPHRRVERDLLDHLARLVYHQYPPVACGEDVAIGIRAEAIDGVLRARVLYFPHDLQRHHLLPREDVCGLGWRLGL